MLVQPFIGNQQNGKVFLGNGHNAANVLLKRTRGTKLNSSQLMMVEQC